MSSHSTRSGNKTRIGVAFCVHDDHWFLEAAIASFFSAGDVFVFLSEVPWNGEPGAWERVRTVAEKAGATVISGGWPAEILHRQCAVRSLIDRGFTHCLMPDTDEIPEPSLLKALVDIAGCRLAERVYVHMDTYWKHPDCVIRPREQLTPLLMFELAKVHPIDVQMFNGRLYDGGRRMVLPPEYGVLHHLSYVGPDERIQRKISTWSHSHEVLSQWWNAVWLAWDQDRLMRNLHPTHPPVYGSVERIKRPDPLADVPDYRAAPGAENPFEQPPARWPKVSIVIPLHGGPKDISQCLDSLGRLQALVHETIVVDDASPDDAANVAAGFGFVTLLKNEENLGFAKACNRGYGASTGSVILFLNSDTIVPRAGLIRLVESLAESGSIGAAGPLSNNVGYYQRIEPTYTSNDNLDMFAEDLALSERDDRDVEMLVGFALAVKRSVLEEVGLFDERFGRGMFEDTDLCYRIARAGYRLRLANRAYIHHFGSRTLARTEPDVQALLSRNGELYKAKWHRDLESGYASHLPGFNVTQGLVVFNPDRHPDKQDREIARLRDRAKISLCMIVRNEERSLGACLESAKPFVSEIIVVDTGSTDRTKEIAKEHGAILREMVWPDSFAEARNESMKKATGDWIFWLDADDVLPFDSGMTILRAASEGKADAFVVPVQFVTNGLPKGTSVDHVKLFRNLPGLKWRRRIHEQILSELTSRGIQPAKLPAMVLHAHYDASPEGQARKLERDRFLLQLEYEDDPEDPFTLFNWGMTENHAGNYPEAIGWLTKALSKATPQMTHTRKIYAILACSLRDSGQPEKALDILGNGLSHFPDDPELHYQAALILRNAGRFRDAIDHLRSYGESASDHYSSIDTGILTYMRWSLLGDLYAELGDYEEALKWYGISLEREPWYVPPATGLFDAARKFKDLARLEGALNAILSATGASSEWANRAVVYAEMVGGPANVVPYLSVLLQQHQDKVEPRLTLGRTLLNQGRIGEAINHLHLLERVGVPEAAFWLSVAFEQVGDAAQTMRFAERACELNPAHPGSAERLKTLQQRSGRFPTPVLKGEERHLVLGPHVGKLGPATKRHSVVIVTYNSEALIGPCLDSILATLGKDGELIVVDNGSRDGTAAIVKRLAAKRVRLIQNKKNLGYSKAANQGILASHGEFVTLLNPDTEAGEGMLEKLAGRFMKDVGAVGPLGDNIGGDQPAGHYLPPNTQLPWQELSALLARARAGQQIGTALILGVCVMLKRDTLNEVGLLDEALFLGADDLELSWRLQALGKRLVIALDTFVHHVGHASFVAGDKTADLVARSDAALIAKLKKVYGERLPTSHQLWGCDVFDEAFLRK